MHWRRKWQPTPVLLPGESQGGEAWLAAVYGVAQSWTQLKQRSSSCMAFQTQALWILNSFPLKIDFIGWQWMEWVRKKMLYTFIILGGLFVFLLLFV